jgi:transcriptional regulator with XRE-family HTH domain
MKERTVESFGKRLREIRSSRGLSQIALGAAVGVSNRVIHYYEEEGRQPPGAILVDLARTLGVSTDELLGLKPVKAKTSPKAARLVKRLQRVADLPPEDQRAVLKFVDALVTSRGINGNGKLRRLSAATR